MAADKMKLTTSPPPSPHSPSSSIFCSRFNAETIYQAAQPVEGTSARCELWEQIPLALRPSTIPKRLSDRGARIAARPLEILYLEKTRKRSDQKKLALRRTQPGFARPRMILSCGPTVIVIADVCSLGWSSRVGRPH